MVLCLESCDLIDLRHLRLPLAHVLYIRYPHAGFVDGEDEMIYARSWTGDSHH
jgi:hypothetical protein